MIIRPIEVPKDNDSYPEVNQSTSLAYEWFCRLRSLIKSAGRFEKVANQEIGLEMTATRRMVGQVPRPNQRGLTGRQCRCDCVWRRRHRALPYPGRSAD